MNKADKIKDKRKKYIQSRVDAVKNKSTEIKRIADELFLSEVTIYRDLKK